MGGVGVWRLEIAFWDVKFGGGGDLGSKIAIQRRGSIKKRTHGNSDKG
jgi:hypothetical protein